MTPKYFIIEGCDGVGKSTTIKTLSKLLDLPHVLTKEPGGPVALAAEWNEDYDAYPFGPRYAGFRQICVDHPEIPQQVKRALFKADSIYNWLHCVKPSLDAGNIVISDRGWPSDLAYGKALAGYELATLYNFNISLSQEHFAATHVIYLDLQDEIREQRLSTNVTNEMDKIGKDKRNEINYTYKEVLHQYIPADRQLTIRTDIPVEQVARYIINWIKNLCTS